MGVRKEGKRWCFCIGGRTERLKGNIFSCKGPAMACISSSTGRGEGAGFLIHPNLLLTTHTTLPSAMAAEAAEIQLNRGCFPARLAPNRFFITSTVLDLTVVGVNAADTKTNSQGHQPHHLKACVHPTLDLGSTVYLLSFSNKKELVVGEGKVVISTDNLIKLSAEGMTWRSGSAGFDAQGNLALMICDPMKLASSSTCKSFSDSSSSSSMAGNGDSSMLFGIPIPIICDWLHRHWEGSLDELTRPKLSFRLLSGGQKSDLSCASFNRRHIFKPEEEPANTSSLTHMFGKSRYQQRSNGSSEVLANGRGISTSEMFESPRNVSGPIRRENPAIQLLDINFPPRLPRSIVLPRPLKQLLLEPREIARHDSNSENTSIKDDCHSEVQSSSSLVEGFNARDEGEGFSSGEETMYSAETMESRNIPSPPKEARLHQVGRSRSCVSYNRWSASPITTAKRRGMLQIPHSTMPPRKAHSLAVSLSHKSHEYFSPTVSSSMKMRNGSDHPPSRSRQEMLQVSPKWIF